MTNTISVPRELLERSLLDLDAAYGHGLVVRKLRAILAARAVEAEGLEVFGYKRTLRMNGNTLSVTYTEEGEAGQFQDGIYVEQVESLCSLPKAQAIIGQQAARIAELEREICYLMGQINGGRSDV